MIDSAWSRRDAFEIDTAGCFLHHNSSLCSWSSAIRLLLDRFSLPPVRPNDLFMVSNETNSLRGCLTTCVNDIRCRTVNFDQSTHQCSLFSSWISEGSPSTAVATSVVAFIPQTAALYTTYNQACSSGFDPIGRYLRCVSGFWQCPTTYFFNGDICDRPRSFNQTCQTDVWCDSSTYLICGNPSLTCLCNATMEWNGSCCVPSLYDRHRFSVNHLTLFSLFVRPFWHPFQYYYNIEFSAEWFSRFSVVKSTRLLRQFRTACLQREYEFGEFHSYQWHVHAEATGLRHGDRFYQCHLHWKADGQHRLYLYFWIVGILFLAVTIRLEQYRHDRCRKFTSSTDSNHEP